MEEISEIREKEERGFDGYHDYRILFCHGRSAIGTVSAYGRRWFVKSLRPQFSESSSARESLRKEFSILLGLNHPGIVRVIQFVEIPGAGPSIIMEFLNGKHLDEAVKDMKRSQRILIANQLLDALEYLHSQGVTHGDLKPENVIVRGPASSPRLTLIDFNIADSEEYTVDKEAGGNRRYAAPEQFDEGYRLAPSADVYSAALILKELRLGLGWHATIRKSLAADSGRRLEDAAAMKHRRVRSRRSLFVLAFLFLSAILGVFLMILLARPAIEHPGPEAVVADSVTSQANSEQAPVEEHVELTPGLNESQPKEATDSESNQMPRELVLLDPQRRKAEAEIAKLIDANQKKIHQILADSTLTKREKLIKLSSSEVFSDFLKIYREVYDKIPPKYIIEPPNQEWRDFISQKQMNDFTTGLSKTIKELEKSEN